MGYFKRLKTSGSVAFKMYYVMRASAPSVSDTERRPPGQCKGPKLLIALECGHGARTSTHSFPDDVDSITFKYYINACSNGKVL